MQLNRRWFHSFEFDDGSTIVGDKSLSRLRDEADVVFRVDITGKTVLDIGAWDGYFSFDAEKRGASLVHATDHYCWSGAGWGTKEGFDFIHKKMRSRVHSTDVDVYDLTPTNLGSFDVVLFLGVLYHLTDPFSALKIVRSMTNEVAIIETHVDLLDVKEPAMRFYSGAELNDDPTNFWGPNMLCLSAMLREVGFARVEFRPIGRIFPSQKSSRIVAHAWK